MHKRCASCGQQIYLFIDEYDHFTNKILSEPDCRDDYRSQDPDTVIERLRQQAIKQALMYASSEKVQQSIGHTTLHRIVVVYTGMSMVVCEAV